MVSLLPFYDLYKNKLGNSLENYTDVFLAENKKEEH